jgi:hypothetical protein
MHVMQPDSKRYELDFLLDRSDEALLDEVRRVAALVPGPFLFIEDFHRLSKISVSTLRTRFGGWKQALERAGRGQRHVRGGRTRKAKRAYRSLAREEIIADLKAVAMKLGRAKLGRDDYRTHGQATVGQVCREFGSWNKAVSAAGLDPLGRRFTREEKLANLALVWEHYGRAPEYLEMKHPPSRITGKAYAGEWGSWRKALVAFVEWANGETEEQCDAGPAGSGDKQSPNDCPLDPASSPPHVTGGRDVPARLRLKVLFRDRFRCVYCGRSPATELGVTLHVDHKQAWSKGGPTEFNNLQTLCDRCNLGKGDMDVPAYLC